MNPLFKCLRRTRRRLTVRPDNRSRLEPVVDRLLAHHVIIETDRSMPDGVGRLEGTATEQTVSIDSIVERLSNKWLQETGQLAGSPADDELSVLLDSPVSLIRHRTPADLVSLTMEMGRRAYHVGEGRICASLIPEMGAFEAAIGRAAGQLVDAGLTVTTVVEDENTPAPAGNAYVDEDGAFDDVAFLCFDGGPTAAGGVFVAQPAEDGYEVLISFDRSIVDSVVGVLDEEFPGLLGEA